MISASKQVRQYQSMAAEEGVQNEEERRETPMTQRKDTGSKGSVLSMLR